MRCPHCGADNLPRDSNYCDICGQSLRDTPEPTPSHFFNGSGRDSAQEYFERGQHLYQQGDYAGAVAAYRRAIDLDATHTTYFCELARAYLRLNQPEQALNAARDAISIKPQLPYPHFLLGYIHYTQGRCEDALTEYHRALDLEETGADIYYYIGKAHEKLGETGQAVAAYRQAIQQDPKHPYAQERLGSLG